MFNLVSNYKPTGDQPEAIEYLSKGIEEGKKFQTLLGVTGSGKTFTMANVIQKVQKPTLILAHNKTLAGQLYSEFKEFFPENAVEYFVSYYDYYQPESYIPSSDTYIEKDSSVNDEIDKLRHSATLSLFERKDVIIVASVSCIYGLGDPEDYQELMLSLRPGMQKGRNVIMKKLVEMQYTRNEIDFKRGTFRAKGDILEIYPSNQEESTLRVEFWGDEIEKIAEINFKEENFYPIEIYVQNNKLALIGNIAYNENLKMSTEMQDISEAPKSKTGIIIYDITDRSNPKEIRNVMLEGSYITSMSRMIDENIYFAVSENIYGYDISCKSIEELNENDYMPKYTDTAISNEEKCISYDKIYNLDETEDANYLILVGININGDNEADIQTFLGAGTYLYSSEKNMYIATNEVEYDENYKVINTKTKLMKFELNNGKIIYKAKGKVEGSVNNQFSMDENGDNFRIATTIGEIWSNQNTSNNLYVLNDKLEEIGKIEGLAEGEKIYSVRYMGSKAYVVTFKQTDPFWVIDLSDATNPQILGEVQLPGYSVYLHPYDEKHIIGFGYDTKENGTRVTNNGLKLVMFDVSDFTNPQVVFQIAVGDSKYTYSELLYNHKSAIFSKEKGIMAFPINSSSGLKTNSRAVIYKIDLENGFSLQGEIGTISNNYEEEVRRIVFVNGNYYTLSYSQVRVADMDSLNVFKIIDI